MEGVDLEVRPQALQAIATKALARKTGARGLRSILEQVLLDLMFDLPTMENVSKVVVDENTIIGEGKPLLIYTEPPKVAGTALATAVAPCGARLEQGRIAPMYLFGSFPGHRTDH